MADLTSAIYEGRIRHRRFQPIQRRFQYRIFMLYLDLAEIDTVFSIHPLWSRRRRAPARFRRADYLGPPERPLAAAVRDRFAAETGRRPTGPVRMLTHLRYWGLCFNPVTFYYLFEDDGETLAGGVAEVTNTPWGERHAYVLGAGGSSLRAVTPKAFHVSPLMGMDHQYDIHLLRPGSLLLAHIGSERQGEAVFDATLTMRRTPITSGNLTRMLVFYPPMPALIQAGIYLEALRTRLRGARWHPHPERSDEAAETDAPVG